ncbi:ABC transporter ATP-binding protein [Corynebacterium glyciniphilum]|uniref:ABC transporter ATP-binding protein n=1 Tax=Corynebacterium glyciniphilum TaxID=1404244 RepID=UPI00264DA7CB|nr:ATP-binding cassette domain-containing protein [Corynebacterium glyciniphilum]MDN5683123.1 ATP-binding cassette domain-containing protein [Corynebacterium glyciniphilum]MDN6706819.1 ATP-binding cassette domain-containing protein [Corynebacterium glyciniphilum]
MTNDRQNSGAEIELSGITKRYSGQDVAAVEDLNLTIPAGETVMFVGPSGCGKTTSLKMINRLIEPSEGIIRIGGEDVTKKNPTELRRSVGYVIQGGGLLPHMTVAQNIGLVPGLLKWEKKQITDRVDELLDLVGLDPATYRDRFPRELSGGQQQRVGVARGLAADPPVLLMDEPFGAVDPITRQRLQDELISLQNELHKTIVCVTHDIDEAVKLGDRILVLREQARIAQYDTPAQVLGNPSDDYVADFVGSGSKLKQLSLLRVDDVGVDDFPTCTVGEDSAEVVQRVTGQGKDSVIILDGRDRPRDWVWLRTLQSHSTVPAPDLDLETTVERRSTVNDALDSMLVSSHGGAIVTDRGRYAGVIYYEAVTEYIRALNSDGGQ